MYNIMHILIGFDKRETDRQTDRLPYRCYKTPCDVHSNQQHERFSISNVNNPTFLVELKSVLHFRKYLKKNTTGHLVSIQFSTS